VNLLRLERLIRARRVAQTTNLWKDLADLFDLIDRGHGRYGVQAYNGGLFDLEGDSFLAEKALPDWYLARVLDHLGRTSQPDRPELGLFRVDYRDLAIQQIGGIIGHDCPPAEDHPCRDARRWRARDPELLLGLQVQPLDRDQRGPVARSRPALRSRGAVRMQSL
jgi:hypothetical protein